MLCGCFSLRAAIDLSTDLSNRISIVTSKPNSECVDATDDRVAVNFGENLRSGCFIKYGDCVDLNSLICKCKIVLKQRSVVDCTAACEQLFK